VKYIKPNKYTKLLCLTCKKVIYRGIYCSQYCAWKNKFKNKKLTMFEQGINQNEDD